MFDRMYQKSIPLTALTRSGGQEPCGSVCLLINLPVCAPLPVQSSRAKSETSGERNRNPGEEASTFEPDNVAICKI